MVYLCLKKFITCYVSGALRIRFFVWHWIMLHLIMFLLTCWELNWILRKHLFVRVIYFTSLLCSCSQFDSTRWFEGNWWCCTKIRECIKYVKGTQGRKVMFFYSIKQMSLDGKKGLRQDVPTRWNSTFLMLESAIFYRHAFHHLVSRSEPKAWAQHVTIATHP